MEEKYISSIHVEKLGHHIWEIRERALMNIVSKLERGFIYDNELARSREILIRLFDWFKFDEYDHESIVLNLMKCILKTECGGMLINLFGASDLKHQVLQIKGLTSSDGQEAIDDILQLLQTKSNEANVVPPLESDVPLSYRSNDSLRNGFVGSTASPIEGFMRESASVEPGSRNLKTVSSEAATPTSRLPYYTLPWQTLVAPDRHVLESVEESLRNPTEPSVLLNSCEFFSNVLLHDFPAEVFLQRPSIIKLFHDLLWSSPSSRITTAILMCLEKLTTSLRTRILYYSDPCTYDLKTNYFTAIVDSTSSTPMSPIENNENSVIEQWEETAFLMKKQMTLPQYCMNTVSSVFDYLYVPPGSGDGFKRKKCQVGINTCLLLLKNSVLLLKMCMKRSLWCDGEREVLTPHLNRMNDLLVKFGEVLEHFRLEVMSSDWKEDVRTIHLYLLCSFMNLFDGLVPVSANCDSVLPKNLKSAVANSLLDPAFSRLFPGFHENLVLVTKRFVGSFETNSFRKYEQVEAVCTSMSAAITFLRSWKSMPTVRNVWLAREALLSLEFHGSIAFLANFVELCANKLSLHSFEEDALEDIDYIVVSCLAHKSEELKSEMYRLCRKRVVSTIGARTNVSKSSVPGDQILFLLRSRVLQEIVAHGLVDPKEEVRNFAEDILIHVLKCKILVSDDIWGRAVEAVLPVLPLIVCHVDKPNLGRTILNILDPDRSNVLGIPTCEVVRGNSALLFVDNAQIREEAVSRLCWLLSSGNRGANLLPHINNLHDRALGLICQLDRVVDYGRYKSMQHFYQPSGLQQVIDLLNSENVEPVIRRSATTQISVMMEDPILHQTFIEGNGVTTIKNIMLSALTEDDYRDYPDSIIACISILKNVCLYNTCLRQELSNDVDVYMYTLRGMFMFCTEERVKQDGSILLFLLVYSAYILGTPIKNDLSVPDLVASKLKCPFQCSAHWKTSKNSLPSLIDFLNDKWSLSSLQIHWNLEWFGGLEEMLPLGSVKYDKSATFSNSLKMNSNDLLALKSTSLEYNINRQLETIKNGSSCAEVMNSVNQLTGCVLLYELVKGNLTVVSKDINSFPWEESFDRYLRTPPSSPEDNLLLAHVLRFVCVLIPNLKIEEKPFWICAILKEKRHYFADLLGTDCLKESEMKQLMRALLDLITITVRIEQHRSDFSSARENGSHESWTHLVEVIVEHLRFNDTQHFYNLAYLDHLLSTLVHLTSGFGWSGSKANEPPRKLLIQLTVGLFELIDAFHCGKGPSAADSVMGLSIIRHVVLILNHVLAEMQHFQVKHWEAHFMRNDTDSENNLASLCSLRLSHDVILRAGVFHLLAGLATSPRASAELVQCVLFDDLDVWDVALASLLNHEEASSVRENAAMVLTNLVSHTTEVGDEVTVISSVLPSNSKWGKDSQGVKIVLNMLKEQNFYKELGKLLQNLYADNYFHFHDLKCANEVRKDKESTRKDDLISLYSRNMELACLSVGSDSNRSGNEELFLSTPGLIKAVGLFVHNLLVIAPHNVCIALQEHGLIKLFLRCLILPSVEIHTTKDLSLYCEILEMNTAIYMLLGITAVKSLGCLYTIRNTRDCLSLMISQLNPSLYHTSFPQLFYLRNRLWSAIFNLIETTLMSSENDIEKLKLSEFFGVIANIIGENGQESFLQSLCQSINTTDSNDLQFSALSSLTSLLRVGEKPINENDSESCNSMQNLLDFTKTPQTPRPEKQETEDTQITTFNVLEHVYFGSFVTPKSDVVNDDDTDYEMAGAELCKILLHLYDVVSLKNAPSSTKKRSMIINALTGLLSISKEAKRRALADDFMSKLFVSLKEIHIKLSIESVDCLRRVADKKRVCPVLRELESLLGMLTNFMVDDGRVKSVAASMGLADVCHKLWIWFSLQKSLMMCALRMLCTFTNSSYAACQSLPLTSSVAGSGPRKVPSNISLLQAVSTLIGKEMEQVSRTHDLTFLQLSFHLLHNCTSVVDCRTILIKNNLLQSLSRLHPAITKRQKPWDSVETLWLDFLAEFTLYPEGQSMLAKSPDVLELLISITSTSKPDNRQTALEVLRNMAFYQQNRSRLLTSDDFLCILSSKLSTGSVEEKNIVVSIIWTLAANNQKAKLVFKCAHIDSKLQDAIKVLQLAAPSMDSEDLDRMYLVLKLLRDGDKSR